MMIRVQWYQADDVVMAEIAMGLKGKTATYDVKPRGTLQMSTAEWALFKQTLERGAGKGVIVMIEGRRVLETKKVDDDTAKEASPF